ncbi:MAG TPA: hypothetical protein VN847_26175, partial [Streptosporangiaceae bacterium]|nr:hypothetical protein [Streptosporangiaceae bacterium]
TLALAFTALLIALTVRDLDQPAGSGGYFGGAGRRWPPAVAKGGRVALGVTMPFILIIMI